MSPSEEIVVARVLKSRGRHGEVAVQELSDADQIFEPGGKLTFYRADESREFTIEESWHHQGRLILKFEGVDTISDAEELKGWEARIAPSDLPPTEEGEHYYFELIGCQVFENETDRFIGRVEAVQEPGGQIVLEVVAQAGDGATGEDAREILIPYPLVVEIDAEGKRIVADLPEGLEELNA